MTTRVHDATAARSLEDFVVSRKQHKSAVPSSERSAKASQYDQDEEKQSDVESSSSRARPHSKDIEKKRPESSKDVDPSSKKRKQTASSSSDATAKQGNSGDHDKAKPAKRPHVEHPSSPSPREAVGRPHKAKAASSSHVSEAKADTHKLVGAFVQSVEKVLNQYDGEKDRDVAFKMLQKDYLALLNVRQTEPERLLAESNRIAKEAKALHADANTKLRQQVANLTKKLDKYDKLREHWDRIKARSGDVLGGADDSDAMGTLKHENAIMHAENNSLRNRVKNMERELELERSTKHATQVPPAHATSSTEINRLESAVADLTGKLVQANKLLGVYELISSMHIDLTSASDDKVQASCRAIDSLDAQQFSFRVGIPTNPRQELEYMPATEEVDHYHRQAEPTVPEYLLEELNFQRSELTRFMRTILEAVIRKKA
ncbi:hypothetical protein DYB38_003435 [Aphanomyces astaci]|uniref:Monopolin complex subunit Csm1/Pcs1 C-terminal domain-containing protein n=1 Tax=Aphanomyces astaci TaxID=112090 RepID=A0A397E7X4_APHAT|nr:hypothetical protein DYB38_003435 [Aphanomyces astaci]